MTIRSHTRKRIRLLDKSNEASRPLAPRLPNIGGNEGVPSLHVRKRTTIWRRKAMTRRMTQRTFLVLSLVLSASAQDGVGQVEPNAGSWKTWAISSGKDF